MLVDWPGGRHNGPPSWTEMERVLTGKPRCAGEVAEPKGGGDSPAWSRRRELSATGPE